MRGTDRGCRTGPPERRTSHRRSRRRTAPPSTSVATRAPRRGRLSAPVHPVDGHDHGERQRRHSDRDHREAGGAREDHKSSTESALWAPGVGADCGCSGIVALAPRRAAGVLAARLAAALLGPFGITARALAVAARRCRTTGLAVKPSDQGNARSVAPTAGPALAAERQARAIPVAVVAHCCPPRLTCRLGVTGAHGSTTTE